MRQVLKVKRIVSRTRIQAEDSSLRLFSITTDRKLSVGQTVVVTNGVVTATITKRKAIAYEV